MIAAHRQRGVALVVMLALIGIAFAALLLSSMSGSRAAIERDQITARALERAREALLAYAISVDPDSPAKRPGDLPCPDLDNDGSAETTCSASTGRIGRLPWRTLRLDDLRDGDGERLWYVLSGNFDRSTSNQCDEAGDPGCLNSDTLGTLTVRDATGTVVHDGTNLDTGAVAVVLAPGAPLQRLGGSVQDRSCTGDASVTACQQTLTCSAVSTPLCNPVNYLDVAGPPALTVSGAAGNTEDNATFADQDASDGLINGRVLDGSGNVIVNDRILVLSQGELMKHLERRVVQEAADCLDGYQAASAGRYPWAASVTDDYRTSLADAAGQRFGRLPISLTASDDNAGMSSSWPASCPADSSGNHVWWNNWRNLVFYGVGSDFAPTVAANPTACGSGCLTLNPPSAADRRYVVIVAGRRLATQTTRGVGAAASQYLEGENDDGADQFRQAAASSAFNDRALAY